MQEIIPQTKKCSKCKVDRPFDMFTRTVLTKDGLYPQCKECRKAYRVNNKEKIKEKDRLYNKNNNEYVTKKKREYYQKNKDKVYKQNKAYRDNNKEKVQDRFRLYYQKNKEEIAKKAKEYRKTDKWKISVKNSHYKRRTITKKGDATSEQLSELQQNAKVCYWCNKPLKNKVVHVDHYIPLSKGGEHTLSNLVISCDTCNLKKHAKDPIQFAQSIGRLF